jgi:hypothetical protein
LFLLFIFLPSFSFFLLFIVYNLTYLQTFLLFYKYFFSTYLNAPIVTTTLSSPTYIYNFNFPNSFLFNQTHCYYFYRFYTLFYFMNIPFKKISSSALATTPVIIPFTPLQDLKKINFFLSPTYQYNFDSDFPLLYKSYFYPLNENFFLFSNNSLKLFYIYNIPLNFQINSLTSL